MFTIKTSKENKEVVTKLTKRLNLGAENVIARLAFACSLSSNKKLNLENISNAQGKEYNMKVLFGEYSDIYLSMICVHYGLYKSHKDIPRYIKLHVDDGLQLIHQEINLNPNTTGTDFIISKIEKGLTSF